MTLNRLLTLWPPFDMDVTVPVVRIVLIPAGPGFVLMISRAG